MLVMEFSTAISNNAATIYCPNKKSNMRLWLTNVKYVHRLCPSCGEMLRRAYQLSDNCCIDRVIYYSSDNLA